jgi:hypothetical protein
MILNVTKSQRPGRQAVLVRARRAGNNSALQISITLYRDVESTISGRDAGLLGNTRVVA